MSAVTGIRRPRFAGLLATGLYLAFGTAAAHATTYCVNSPTGCSGTAETTITAALAAAETANSSGDLVEIAGDHTYTETIPEYISDNTVTIEGIGADAPLITTASAPSALLSIEDSHATLSNLELELPSGSEAIGLQLTAAATASGITVVGAGVPGNGAVGIDVGGYGVSLTNVGVLLPGSETAFTTGIYLGGEDTVLSGASVDATAGLYLSGATGSEISRLQDVAPIGIDDRGSGGASGDTVADSIFQARGTVQGNQDSRGVVANGPGALLSLVNDTFYNEDTGDDGIDVYGDGGSSAVTLTNSIVEGFQDDLYDSGAGASITTGYDDWHSSASVSGAAPITRAGTDLDVTPDFVSAATGDFHLAAGAPLIDKGDPTPLSGAPATDFYGADRYVAGRGGCSYIVDIGAAEYQVTTPTAVATAPQTASAGVPVAFSGAGSCGPDAASPISSYSWSFGDGAAGAGASVEHAFVTPGIKTVTLTVADAAGGTATRTVTVDVGAPIVTLLGLGRGTRARRPVILFGLSAAGSVRFTLGEWVGAREIRGKCEVPRPYEHGWRPCRGHKRTVTFTLAAGTGNHSFALLRELHRRSLSAGLYTLQAIALPSISKSAGGGIAFTIPLEKSSKKR